VPIRQIPILLLLCPLTCAPTTSTLRPFCTIPSSTSSNSLLRLNPLQITK
jgi:hypothetical protein